MEQTPWEANRSSASQEIPCILRKPKVLYCNHKLPLPVPILNQIDPVHTPTSHCLKIHLNIILPSMPGSPKWFFPCTDGYTTTFIGGISTNLWYRVRTCCVIGILVLLVTNAVLLAIQYQWVSNLVIYCLWTGGIAVETELCVSSLRCTTLA
jgi:hypothetical protein